MRLEIGTNVDKYQLVEHIGVGSSGEIWKATGGGKTVAIKFMRENLVSSRAADKHRERLEREINALQTLNHPSIPKIFESNLEFERPYFVMEFIDSSSLDKLIDRGTLVKNDMTKRMNIIESIASALSMAHDHNIIHRDIKPGNINGVDKPYLMDFSIALAAENTAMTNFNIGTSIYMPPDFDAPDALGDSWSFAVVAYEILFGRHPIFDYDDPVIKKGMLARFEAKKRLDDGEWFKPTRIPKETLPNDLKQANLQKLDEIFTKALGDRDARYKDLVKFAKDLRDAIFIPTNLVVQELTGGLKAEDKPPALALDAKVTGTMKAVSEDGAVAQSVPSGGVAVGPVMYATDSQVSRAVLSFSIAMAVAISLAIIILALGDIGLLGG